MAIVWQIYLNNILQCNIGNEVEIILTKIYSLFVLQIIHNFFRQTSFFYIYNK